ncbi:MAG TPA: hypothetical protein VK913_07750, partial [Erythrobacter sp.]|nr:hypothetical protein [Erythrobacter sp.]
RLQDPEDFIHLRTGPLFQSGLKALYKRFIDLILRHSGGNEKGDEQHDAEKNPAHRFPARGLLNR